MDPTCLCSYSSSKPLSSSPSLMGFGRNQQRNIRSRTAGKAFAGGRPVDESMIVLRRRIHEMKVIERNYEPPEDWMYWEKQCYGCYDEFVCNLVGVLQSCLMNTRPSLALGMIVLITMSVPASTAMILFRLMELANGTISSVHLG
ncbi:hypothetical protein FNV43_RR14954 [Rhamnella rubrinervis]|uniref:Mediator of RNA polymerase II transcription subunit n=1 Tax=Rhamnella rubrinervis TaxID=2594499 RepID=A0A8K0H4A9_9ROSA|nr:hypothetical protein FNV43_RR14954 [Rhamnella rubrinervis]